jgi:hypothetical protein
MIYEGAALLGCVSRIEMQASRLYHTNFVLQRLVLQRLVLQRLVLQRLVLNRCRDATEVYALIALDVIHPAAGPKRCQRAGNRCLRVAELRIYTGTHQRNPSASIAAKIAVSCSLHVHVFAPAPNAH